MEPRELIFQNGYGGFTRDGHEYVITLADRRMTPAPWVNVLANPHFGTVVSESGAAYTWVENSHEFRLTPWSNDPVQDTPGEAFYLRDEQTGQFWSPTPLPRARDGAVCHSPRVWLHGVRAHRERHCLGTVGLCGDGRAGEVFRPQGAECVGPFPADIGDRLLGMGVGRAAAEKPASRANRGGPQDGRVARAEPLQHGVPRAHRVPRRERWRAHAHGRSQGIPRPQRHPGPAGGDEKHASLRHGRRRGSIRAAPCNWPSIWRRAGARDDFPAWRGALCGRGADPDPALPPERGEPRGARGSLGLLEPHARRGERRHARPGG